MEVWQLLRLLRLLPVGEEVRQGLRLDCLAWLVLDVVDSDLDDPLGDSSSRFTVADDVLQRCQGDDRDWMLLEIVRELPLGSEDRIYQLLVLRVALSRLG